MRQIGSLIVTVSICSWICLSDATIDYSCVHSTAWKMNTGNTAPFFSSALTDITSSSLVGGQWKVVRNRIPRYDYVMTASEVTSVNSRPKVSTDFTAGHTTAVAGTTYSFGANIGYKTTGCSLGYWPPGPMCPTVSSGISNNFDLTPSPETKSSGCFTSQLGPIGVFSNGISIYGWSDGVSYNSQNVWHDTAPSFEVYDLDICYGHAANGDYHHHHYPICLQTALGDTGSDHSPIYGWGYDSYPLYGPYQATGVLAQSCWKVRDYSSSSPTGCSTGTRCCTLTNNEDYTQGTTSQTGKCGPSLTGTVTTQSGNTISAASGTYYEDYYFNATCAAQGGVYLDKHNGHSHGSYGYHYHVTITSNGEASFPYTMGPKYYGCRTSTCCGSAISNSCGTGSTCGATDGATSNACTTSQVTTEDFPTANPSSSSTDMPTAPTAAPTTEPTSSTASPTIPPTIGSPGWLVGLSYNEATCSSTPVAAFGLPTEVCRFGEILRLNSGSEPVYIEYTDNACTEYSRTQTANPYLFNPANGCVEVDGGYLKTTYVPISLHIREYLDEVYNYQYSLFGALSTTDNPNCTDSAFAYGFNTWLTNVCYGDLAIYCDSDCGFGMMSCNGQNKNCYYSNSCSSNYVNQSGHSCVNTLPPFPLVTPSPTTVITASPTINPTPAPTPHPVKAPTNLRTNKPTKKPHHQQPHHHQPHHQQPHHQPPHHQQPHHQQPHHQQPHHQQPHHQQPHHQQPHHRHHHGRL